MGHVFSKDPRVVMIRKEMRQEAFDKAVLEERQRALGVLAYVGTCPELRKEIWQMAVDGTTPDQVANKLLQIKAHGAYGANY